MGHDADFAAFREDRARERANEVRVTWRRVSKDTGGGYSGLGPNGLLVYVAPSEDPAGRGQHDYGRVEGKERIRGGARMSLNEAKRAAENLMRRMVGQAPYQSHPTAAKAAEGDTPMSNESTPTITEALAEGIGEVAGDRILANGHRLAYVNPRKDGAKMDVSARDVEGAPSRFQKMLGEADKRGYRAMHVTAKNLKGARALLEWIAKQAA